jgi:hypothetical protein
LGISNMTITKKRNAFRRNIRLTHRWRDEQLHCMRQLVATSLKWNSANTCST